MLNLKNGVSSSFEDVLSMFYKDDAKKISKYLKLMQEENYREVFKALGFRYEYNEHGQILLADYKPKVSSDYTLHDLGIDENKLMQNVIELGGDYSTIRLDGSALTALPNLVKIKGRIDLGDCRTSDLSSLEEYHGVKIYWEKP